MEHEEIVLDQKQDPRNKGTRYGIKGRGTTKYNRYQDYMERKFTGEVKMVTPVQSVQVSLKKRKNWEVSQQSFDGTYEIRIIYSSHYWILWNKLWQAGHNLFLFGFTFPQIESNDLFQLDSDVNTRVVIVDNNDGFNWRELNKKLHPEEPPKEEKPEIINGSNRKGFFVREKRKPGKKGVNRKANVSDGESSEDDELDSNEQEGEKKEEVVLCVLTVPRGKQADIWNKAVGGCNCRGCNRSEKNLTTKNRNIVKKEIIDLL